jgi:hypothetical protein
MKIFLNLLLFSFYLILALDEQNRKKIVNNENIKYLEFSFKRNLTINDSLKPEELIKTLFYNQIYVNIKIGTNKKEIPFYLYLQQYPLVIQSSNVSNKQVKGIYNKSESDTYEAIGKEESFIVDDMSYAILSQDNFYFNNDNTQSLISFYLCVENYEKTHITEGGKIGFKLYSTSAHSEKSSFISILKKNRIISSYVFSIIYNTKDFDEDTGKLYIGAYPHILDKKHYTEDYFISGEANNVAGNIEWNLNFDEIKVDNKLVEKNSNSYFYIEIGFLIGKKAYFNYIKSLDIWNEYFNINKKCHEAHFKIDDLETNDIEPRLNDDYTVYYCDKDVDIEKLNFGDISFVKKSRNISFEFTNKDLWMEKNGYKYFLVIENQFFNDNWYFGKPFFKKYPMIFDSDNKIIGLYTKTIDNNSNSYNETDNSNSSTLVYIIVIVGLVIIVIGLIILLINCYMKLPRKMRPNELTDDNYDYSNPINNN